MRDLGLVFTDYNYIWQDVGLQLKLKQVVLGTIAANNPLNQRNCFRETLQKWLQMDVNATWETLELAITNAKRHQLGYGKLTSSKSHYMILVHGIGIKITFFYHLKL